MLNNQLFEKYIIELLAWNQKFNLTAITNPEEIKLKHFADSLSLLEAVNLTTESVIDVGAGAGFPGIPLKIARPNIKLTLLEATRKKTEFLKHLVGVLGLKDVEIVWGRAEEYKGQFDVAVARAVAKLDKLCGYCLPLVKPGGLFVAYKGEKVEAEVDTALPVIKKLGGRVKEIKKVTLPGSEIIRSLVLVEKN
jgi:16S rRNA (guanine527-N7)-methyltransferase